SAMLSQIVGVLARYSARVSAYGSASTDLAWEPVDSIEPVSARLTTNGRAAAASGRRSEAETKRGASGVSRDDARQRSHAMSAPNTRQRIAPSGRHPASPKSHQRSVGKRPPRRSLR